MRLAAAALALLLAASATARAQTTTVFNRTGSGARAAGMANAFIAVSDDGTAASWNPAGLGQLRSLEISAVTTVAGRTLNASGIRTRDDLSAYTPFGSSYGTAYLDFASLALPFTIAGKPFTVQGAWRALYNLDYHENTTIERLALTPTAPPRLRIEQNIDSAGSIDNISLAAALKLTSRLSVGGSLNLWRGRWTENISVSEAPRDGGRSTFTSSGQTNHLSGHSYSAGLLLTTPRFSVGLVYQLPLRGEFRIEGAAHTSEAPDPVPESLAARMRLPRSLGAGAAWHPAPRWTVAADLTWDQWTDSLIQADGFEAINIFDGLPKNLSATRDTLSANAGAECLLHGEGFVIPLRFGLAWEPQGQRDAYTRDPVNFTMVAAGTGYNTNWLKFDAAVQYRWTRFLDGTSFTARDFDDLLPEAVGERSVREWRLKFSVILRVTDAEKLDKALRRVFGGGGGGGGGGG